MNSSNQYMLFFQGADWDKGLSVDETQALMDRVTAYARELVEFCSPAAMADAKRQIHLDWNADCHTAEDRAKELGRLPGHRADFAEGAASLLEKRAPRFAPLPPIEGAA